MPGTMLNMIKCMYMCWRLLIKRCKISQTSNDWKKGASISSCNNNIDVRNQENKKNIVNFEYDKQRVYQSMDKINKDQIARNNRRGVNQFNMKRINGFIRNMNKNSNLPGIDMGEMSHEDSHNNEVGWVRRMQNNKGHDCQGEMHLDKKNQ